jgi:predicted CXXCH cytochrome family protein
MTGLVLLIVSYPVSLYGDNRIINVIYTGSLQGELEPCGCSPKTDFGGVARLSGYLAEKRALLDLFILIDAGNFTGENTEQGRLKVEAMIKSFSIMKYDAVALLKNEKIFKSEFLKSIIREHKIPAISDAYNLKKSVELKREGTKVNVSLNIDGIRKGMLNILLTDRKLTEAKAIVGWDIIILSSGEEIDEPVSVKGTVIVSGYPKGKKVGVLTVHIDDRGRVRDFSHRWQPLGDDMIESEEVRYVLNDYDRKVAALMKEKERPLSGTTYVGVSRCGECHQLFVESWKETSHGSAFESLNNVGKSADPECLVCHTVGYGEKGGFYSVESTPQLADVQCESCHGLDLRHLSDFSEPMKKVEKSVCLKCHTEEQSPDFEYSTYREIIRHWD